MPANTIPIAVSSFRRLRRLTSPIPREARIAAPRAQRRIGPRSPRCTRYPTATPGRMEWASASPKNAIPWRTTYVPTTAHVPPTTTTARRARTMNG